MQRIGSTIVASIIVNRPDYARTAGTTLEARKLNSAHTVFAIGMMKQTSCYWEQINHGENDSSVRSMRQ